MFVSRAASALSTALTKAAVTQNGAGPITDASMLRKAKIQRPVNGKVGVQHHIKQAALPACRHLEQAINWFIESTIRVSHPQPLGSLGD